MPNSWVNRNDQNSSFLFPTTKLTNISCAFCRHQFFLRELLHLRTPSLPLLLCCGHAACHKCVKIYAGDSCPLCNTATEYEILQDNCLLPVNIYVTGLLTIMTTNAPRVEEPDVSFSQSLSSRMKERSTEGSLCSECGKLAEIKCLQCNDLYCHTCVEKVHAIMKTPQQHFRVLLTNSSEDSIFDTKWCTIHNQFHVWYCDVCELSVCSDCMSRFHPKHQGVPLNDKNNEYMDDFVKAYKKLAETLQQVRQTQKICCRFVTQFIHYETLKTAYAFFEKMIDCEKKFRDFAELIPSLEIIEVAEDICTETLVETVNQEPEEFPVAVRVSEGLRHGSPFFKCFEGLRRALVPVNDNSVETCHILDTEDNDHYCPQLVAYLVEFILPFFPLWSVTIISHDLHILRDSNASVENWFKIVKIDVFQKNLRIPVVRFVKKMKDLLEERIKERKYDL